MQKLILVCLVIATPLFSPPCQANTKSKNLGMFTVTFYDNCKLCCEKAVSHPAYGVTASGERARQGYVACNCLPFGTVLEIEGLGRFTVKDRGAKRLFGTYKRPVKRIDVWVESHDKALRLGKQARRVALLP